MFKFTGNLQKLPIYIILPIVINIANIDYDFCEIQNNFNNTFLAFILDIYLKFYFRIDFFVYFLFHLIIRLLCTN